jgi:energy-coupling factor transporter transmembrane protein EcfT
MLWWLLFVIWLFFGVWTYPPGQSAWRPFGYHLLFALLIFFLGWGVFGFIVSGGGHR